MKTQADYEADLGPAQDALEAERWKYDYTNPDRDTDYNWYLQPDREKAMRSLKGKVNRIQNKIASFGDIPEHKDMFGTVFAAGQRVLHSSASRYAGGKLAWVTKVGLKKITTSNKRDGGWLAHVDPKNIIVVDKLLEKNDV